MIVSFEEDALMDPRASGHLTAIWWRFLNGHHRWWQGADRPVLDSRWFADHGARVQDQIAGQLRAVVRGRPARLAVAVRACGHGASWRDGVWHLPAPLAERWLRGPVIILVENARVDGAFFRLVVLRVGEERLRDRLGEEPFRRLKDRWGNALGDGELFEVRHGGGSETGTQLELLMEAAGSPPPRVLVLLDSDRESDDKDASLGRTAEAVKAFAARLPSRDAGWPVELVILSKREVENYIPHEAIWRVAGRREILNPDFSDLKEIFGKDLAKRAFEHPEAQRHLHARALRDRCGQNGAELHRLVSALCDLL